MFNKCVTFFLILWLILNAQVLSHRLDRQLDRSFDGRLGNWQGQLEKPNGKAKYDDFGGIRQALIQRLSKLTEILNKMNDEVSSNEINNDMLDEMKLD